MNDPGMSTRAAQHEGIAEARAAAGNGTDERHADGSAPGANACASCGAALVQGVSLAESEGQPARWKCLRCACFDRTLAARSGRVALFVGSVLIAVNQGDQLLSGSFPFATAWWKLPLTYLVPFLVASYGAISNGYRPVPRVRGSSASRSG
jgi:hypothetical protein